MGRSRYQRPAPYRKRKRVVLLATEGETEAIYFSALKLRHRETVTVAISPGRAGEVNPERVLARLRREIKAKNIGLLKGDSAWLVVDTDNWTTEERTRVAKEIRHEPAKLAASNPSFELWLLLHFRDAWPAATGNDLCNLLKTEIGKFDKTSYDAHALLGLVDEAMARASRHDKSANNEWPAPGTTQVHRCVTAIIEGKQ